MKHYLQCVVALLVGVSRFATSAADKMATTRRTQDGNPTGHYGDGRRLDLPADFVFQDLVRRFSPINLGAVFEQETHRPIGIDDLLAGQRSGGKLASIASLYCAERHSR